MFLIRGSLGGGTVKLSYDLHIHSALSPCADNDMTPNNIVNMSIIKGLDVIAITDHNSCANLEAVLKCASSQGLIVIPGMELETAEEIHVLCFFRDLESALCMQKIVYENLPDLKNNESIFGEQLILDENDNIISKEERLLLTACKLSINEVFDIVENRLSGAVVPAHINREANSLLSAFGTMPVDINIRAIEWYGVNDTSESVDDIIEYTVMHSSDAHYLQDINESHYFMDIETCNANINCIIDYLLL